MAILCYPEDNNLVLTFKIITNLSLILTAKEPMQGLCSIQNTQGK